MYTIEVVRAAQLLSDGKKHFLILQFNISLKTGENHPFFKAFFQKINKKGGSITRGKRHFKGLLLMVCKFLLLEIHIFIPQEM